MKASISCIFALACCAAAHAEPRVASTEYLGPFVGMGAALHPENTRWGPVRMFGTDLGFSYVRGDRLHFLFGDTLAVAADERIERASGGIFDDMYAWIDRDEWPDPRSIGPGNIPVLVLGQHPNSVEVDAIDPGHVFDGLKTPEAGFTDGENEFAILLLTKPQGCRSDADCDNGMSCDKDLGYIGVPYTQEWGLTLLCFDGAPGCNPDTMMTLDEQPIEGSGFCADPTSSMRTDTGHGRVAAHALRQRIGLRSPSQPGRYYKVTDWMTNKFYNATTRTVPGFDAASGVVEHAGPGEYDGHRHVFVWGRPGFMTPGVTGRNLGLYFAWAEIPSPPDFAWKLHYFAGLEGDGRPRFSLVEQEAAALDLDATESGVQAREVSDIVQHMSVAWIEPLGKWVMFYGGGIDVTPLPAFGLNECGLLEIFLPGECKQLKIGQGAVFMRTADHPWGPWSPPQSVIEGGNPEAPGSGQYGPGGALHHPACREPGCQPSVAIPAWHDRGYGWFYGANIIEPWTVATEDGVEVIWNASTWDPYRAVLLRTEIRK